MSGLELQLGRGHGEGGAGRSGGGGGTESGGLEHRLLEDGGGGGRGGAAAPVTGVRHAWNLRKGDNSLISLQYRLFYHHNKISADSGIVLLYFVFDWATSKSLNFTKATSVGKMYF